MLSTCFSKLIEKINAKCGRQANVQHKQNKMQTKEHKLNQQQQQKQTIEVENENV